MKILKFYTEGCRGCAAMTQFLDLESIPHESVHGIEDPRGKEYDVRNAPTVIILDDEGNEVLRVVGFTSSKAGVIKKTWLQSKK